MNVETTLRYLSLKAEYRRIHLFGLLALVLLSAAGAMAAQGEFGFSWRDQLVFAAVLAVALVCLVMLWRYVSSVLRDGRGTQD